MKTGYLSIVLAAVFFASVLETVGQTIDGTPKMKEIKGKKLLEKLSPQLDKKKQLWGYAGSDGKFIIKPVFKAACPYEGEVARVCYPKEDGSAKWGVINSKGLFAVAPIYDGINSFSSDSIAVICNGNAYALMTVKGVNVLDNWYDSVDYADFGYIIKADGKYGTVDKSGTVLLGPSFDDISVLDTVTSLMHVRKGRKWGILKNGKDVVNLDMDEKASFMRKGDDGKPDLYYAFKEDRIGVVTSDGKYVVPFIYDEIKLSDSEDYYIVRRDGKYGALSLKMDNLIPPVLNSAPVIGDAMFRFCDGGEYYGANKNWSLAFKQWSVRAAIIEHERAWLEEQLPEWALQHIIDGNLASFLERSDYAHELVSSIEGGSFESLPSRKDGMRSSFPKEWRHKHGLLPIEQSSDGCVRVAKCSDNHSFYHSKNCVADSRNPLVKYDAYGNVQWNFFAKTGEVFYDMEETEDYIYLCGSTTAGSYPNVEVPLVLQLTKTGGEAGRFEKPYSNAQFSGVLCDNGLLYLTTKFIKGAPVMKDDYYPHFVLEDMGDNFGIRHSCVWEPWGESAVIGGCGLVDSEGKWIYPPVLPSDEVCAAYGWIFGGFSGDCLIFSHNGNYGLMDRTGAFLIEPQYDKLSKMSNPSYFKASLAGKYGVVDINGNIVVPLEYDRVGSMEEDMIIVGLNGKYGCYDSTGCMRSPLEYDMMNEFSDGKARVRNNGLYGFVDKNGNILKDSSDEDNEDYGISNKPVVSLGGKMLVKLVYDSGADFICGLTPVSQDGKYGYINTNGDFVIPRKYDNAMGFHEQTSLACVAVDGKWGAIDIYGHVLVPIMFDKLEISNDGYVLVVKNGKYGIYSSGGKEIYPPECEKIEMTSGHEVFSHGVATCSYGDGERFRIDDIGNRIYWYSSM